ncbi:MAG: cold shock domain-containing protein [Candidatus Lokiarchaeia archaeon]|nr:cold shock domain-containing protein [Candidatus Lokiarchaeia archaeon]
MAKKKNFEKGFVKWFDAKKGFGFISVANQEDVFVHFSNIDMSGFKKLDMGDEVEFEIKNSNDGKGPEALKVKIVSKDRRY